MADEQKSPPKADNGGETPKPASGASGEVTTPSREVVPASTAQASPAGNPPPGTPGSPVAPNAEPAKPAAAAPVKPAAAVPAKPAGAAPAKPAAPPAPKAPVKPEPWTSPQLDELQMATKAELQKVK